MIENLQKLFFNDKFVTIDKLSLLKCLRGFLYGDGIFETLRVRNYKIFRWKDHWNRLEKGLKICNFETKEDIQSIQNKIEILVRKNDLKDAYVRVNIWRQKPIHLNPLLEKETNLLIISHKFKPYPEKFYKKGIKCLISKNFTKNAKSLLTYIKSFNYTENILAKIEARKNLCDDAILLNTKGNIAEATVSNIFFIKNGNVFTPAIKSGILPGITRKIILEICLNSGIKIKEGFFSVSDLRKADEIFLTNTIMGVMPISEIKGIFKNKNFELTYFLKEKFEKILMEETYG